jgi:hypothetical protein
VHAGKMHDQEKLSHRNVVQIEVAASGRFDQWLLRSRILSGSSVRKLELFYRCRHRRESRQCDRGWQDNWRWVDWMLVLTSGFHLEESIALTLSEFIQRSLEIAKGKYRVYRNENWNLGNFFMFFRHENFKNDPIRAKLENASLIQGNECFVLTRKSKNFGFPASKSFSRGNFMRGIDCAHSRSLKTLL